MRIEGYGSEYGIEADLPSGWEGKVWAPGYPSLESVVGPSLHAGSFPLPTEDGSFGQSASLSMGSQDLFVALVGVGPEMAHEGIYAPTTLNEPFTVADFDPSASPRPVSGLSYVQRFLTLGEWGFSLLVACGQVGLEDGAIQNLEDFLDTVHVHATVAV